MTGDITDDDGEAGRDLVGDVGEEGRDEDDEPYGDARPRSEGRQELALGLHRGKIDIPTSDEVPATERGIYSMLHGIHEKVHHEATHDPLTGLLNAKEFHAALKLKPNDALMRSSVTLMPCSRTSCRSPIVMLTLRCVTKRPHLCRDHSRSICRWRTLVVSRLLAPKRLTFCVLRIRQAASACSRRQWPSSSSRILSESRRLKR